MIDTIRIRQLRKLTASFLATVEQKKRYLYRKLGRAKLKIERDGEWAYYYEISLPKMVFGSNANLIKGDLTIRRAMLKLHRFLNSISVPYEEPRFTRIDLCWQFEVPDVAAVLRIVSQCFHPQIMKRGQWETRGGDTTVTWPSKKRININMYPKSGNGKEILRVEIQLKSPMLKELSFPQNNRIRLLEAYRVFRSILLKFVPNLPDGWKLRSKDEVLFEAELSGFDAMKRLSSILTPRSMLTLRKKFARYVPERFHIDFDQLLPNGSLPRAAEAFPIPVPRVRVRQEE